MNMQSDSIDLGSLLSEHAWLRSLAFRLAGPDAADDVLQQAWIAHRTRAGSVRNHGAWMARVVTNFAKRYRRDRTRRARHEREHAVTRDVEALPAGELVAQMEQQQRVATAVLALPEPYRGTVLAHFLEGRSTKEIAERTGQPWATVRSQLSRGLQMLREDLEADGAQWRDRLALAVFGVPSARLAKSPVATVPAVMAAVLLLSVAVAVPLVWRLLETDTPMPVMRSDAALPPDDPSIAPTEEAREAPAKTPNLVASTAPEVPVMAIYSGEVLDSQGQPMSGVGLYEGTKRVGATNLLGSFAVELPVGPHQLTADSDHWILGAQPLQPGGENRLVATKKIRLRGVVIDAEDGRKVAGARIVYSDATLVDFPYSLMGFEFATFRSDGVTDDAGEFEVAVPWLVGAQISAQADGYRGAAAVRFAPELDGFESVAESVLVGEQEARITTPDRITTFVPKIDVRLAVHRRPVTSDPAWLTWTLDGVVIDADRRPVAGARVSFHFYSVLSGVDGTFHIETGSGNLMEGGSLVAWHEQLGAAVCLEPHARWRDLGTKNPHETLQLQRSDQSLRGRVVDLQGRALAGRIVRIADPIVGVDPGRGHREIESEAFRKGAITDALGNFQLTSLLPRNHRLLVLDPETFQVFDAGEFSMGAAVVDIAVPPPQDLQVAWEGRVVDARGEGIAGAVLTASLWRSWGGLGSAVIHTQQFSCDDAGRVRVPAQCAEGVTVTFEAPGRMIASRARDYLDEREYRLGRRVQFRYRAENPPPSSNQRRLAVLDDRDRQLVVEGPYLGSWLRGYIHFMSGGRTGVLETSELATTLVIYTDDGMEKRDEPHRYPIRLVPGEITVIK